MYGLLEREKDEETLFKKGEENGCVNGLFRVRAHSGVKGRMERLPGGLAGDSKLVIPSR